MKTWQKNFHRQLLQALLPKKIVTPKGTRGITKNSSPEPGEKFSHRVNCTLSKKEFSQLQKISNSLKTCPTKLLKNLAFSTLKQKKFLSPGEEKNLRNLIREIRKIGTNINQIAKQANTLQKVGFSDLTQAHKRISDLEKTLQSAILFYQKNNKK